MFTVDPKQKEMLVLEHQNSTFKIVIPEEVERKIRILCREIHNVEWSGVLFYKQTGSFTDGSLVITCVDIYQMDEGSAAYTEYNMSPDVISYMTSHPELLGTEIYTGLIHSHNNMSSFFSGTDTNTLREEGDDMNHFVSLIVNNAGKYTAGITRKVHKVQNITESVQFNTWGDKSVECDEFNYQKEKDCIEWFNLDIEIEGKQNTDEEEILSRIKEIRKTKTSSNPMLPGQYVPVAKYKPEPNIYKVFTSGANKANEKLPFEEEPIIDYDSIIIDKSIINWLVKQTLTCSIIIPSSSTIDITKWVNSMGTLYGNRFKDMYTFDNFATNFADFLLSSTEVPNSDLDATELEAALAYRIIEALEKLPKNKWINAWINTYQEYIL